MSIDQVVSKAEYALLKNLSRSRLLQWGASGTLVLDHEGQALVDSRGATVHDTAPPLGIAKARSPGAADVQSAALDDAFAGRLIDNARCAKAEAELAEMKAAKARGDYLMREDVARATDACGAACARMLDQVPYAIYFTVAAESDADRCLQILIDAMRQCRTSIADEIDRTMRIYENKNAH